MTSILLGFEFCGVHSSSVGVYLDTPDRTILPARRVCEYVVPGRDGTIDFGGLGYDSIAIGCKLTFKGYEATDRRVRQREIARFLSGSGLLVFDDEPDRGYMAKVQDALTLAEAAFVGEVPVTFVCQPLAESLEYRQERYYAAMLPCSIRPNVAGTTETPCIIRIVAASDIDDLTITKIMEG